MLPIQAGQPGIQQPFAATVRFGARPQAPLFGNDNQDDKPKPPGCNGPDQGDQVNLSQREKPRNRKLTRDLNAQKADGAQQPAKKNARVETLAEPVNKTTAPEKNAGLQGATAPDGDAKTQEFKETSGPAAAEGPKGAQNAKTAQTQAQAKSGRWLGDNSRQALGILFTRIIPLLLALPILGAGPAGLVVGILGFPLAYISGKVGRGLTKDIDQARLSPLFQAYNKLEEALVNPENLNDGEVVDRFNNAKDELFNLIKLPILTNFLRNRLTLTTSNGLGRFMNDMTMLKANMYSDVAQADNVQQAVAAGVKGGMTYLIYFKLFRWLGKGLKAAGNFPLLRPFKSVLDMAGTALENAWLAKLALEMGRARDKAKKPSEQ